MMFLLFLALVPFMLAALIWSAAVLPPASEPDEDEID